MAYNFKSEEDVKQYLDNLGIEYRFGCYNEKNPEVCHLLGDYLEAIKKEYTKSATIYKNNCDEHNYGRSCYKYGVYSLIGKGDQKEDYKIASQYFSKACSLGEANACFNEGILQIFHNEKSGIIRNISKAFSLMEKSCLNNHADACYYLSGLYITGVTKPSSKLNSSGETDPNDYDVPKNMAQAFKFAEKGCELGHMFCCTNLSRMYRNGDGVEKNEELANKFSKIVKDMQEELDSQKTLSFQQGLP